MKILIVVMFAVSTMTAFSQQEIKLDEVKNHVDDSVKVRGIIKGIRYLQSANGSPTFLNLGRAYPQQFLTIVFFQDARTKLGYIPTQEKDLNSVAVVTGKLTNFNGRLQIVITNPIGAVKLTPYDRPGVDHKDTQD